MRAPPPKPLSLSTSDSEPAGISRRSQVTAAPAVSGVTRRVHDANNTEALPGRLVRADGDPVSGDLAVDEAFDSSGQVLDLFASQFDRQSADGNGSPLSITVHYGLNYDNAFWDGTQLVFGDGDGQIFDRFTKPMDVMAHEFTHAVTQFTAGLLYEGQSGALNESISDAFASMAKQRALGQAAREADWLIGEGIFLPGVNARALRSMLEPGTAYDDPQIGKDPQVGSMADYVDTADDNGGVHINSGIPNRAFALLATDLGGESWGVAGKIWYDALVSGDVVPQSDFASFARATLSSARRMFGSDQSVAAKVESAWATVGLLGTGGGGRPSGRIRGGAGAANIVAVRRSGGYAGVSRTGELDLSSDPEGEEVRRLLMQVDAAELDHQSCARPFRVHGRVRRLAAYGARAGPDPGVVSARPDRATPRIADPGLQGTEPLSDCGRGRGARVVATAPAALRSGELHDHDHQDDDDQHTDNDAD